MTNDKDHPSKFSSFWKSFHFQRTLMPAIIAGAAAFSAGAGVILAAWITLASWCLGVGGFNLSAYIRRLKEQREQKAKGEEKQDIPGMIPIFFLFFTAVCFVILVGLLSFSWYPLVVAGVILIFAALLAFQVIKKALTRAIIIGVLHGLHLVLGWSTVILTLETAILAVVLVAAVTGARAMIDIRNFPDDLMTRKKTLPKQFNMTITVKLSILCFILAYIGAIGTYFVSNFSVFYLIPVVLLTLGGVVAMILFVKKAGPTMAKKLIPFFTTVTMLLLSLAMILGQF